LDGGWQSSSGNVTSPGTAVFSRLGLAWSIRAWHNVAGVLVRLPDQLRVKAHVKEELRSIVAHGANTAKSTWKASPADRLAYLATAPNLRI